MSQISNDPSHDKHFFDTFMLVLGILIGVAIVLIFIARGVAAKTQIANVANEAGVQKAITERLTPVARLAVSGQDNSALEPPKPIVVAAAVELDDGDVSQPGIEIRVRRFELRLMERVPGVDDNAARRVERIGIDQRQRLLAGRDRFSGDRRFGLGPLNRQLVHHAGQ